MAAESIPLHRRFARAELRLAHLALGVVEAVDQIEALGPTDGEAAVLSLPALQLARAVERLELLADAAERRRDPERPVEIAPAMLEERLTV